jgi:hypothetical protein
MINSLKCPICGWEGENEICPQCKFPLGKFRPFLSGEQDLYDELLAKEQEWQEIINV